MDTPNKFALTQLSGMAIIFSFMIHYGYTDYTKKNQIKPNRGIFYVNYFLQLLGWIGLILASPNNKLLAGAATVLFFSSVTLMHKRSKINLRKPSTLVLISALGWLVLGFAIPGGEFKSNGRKIGTFAAMVMIFSLYDTIHRSRKSGITDHPGYAMCIGMWIILASLQTTNQLI